MPAITTNDLKTGMHLEVEGNLVQVVDFQHVKPGKGHAFVRTTLKNARNGAVVEKTFRAGEKVERVTVDKREMQYLYHDGSDFAVACGRSKNSSHVFRRFDNQAKLSRRDCTKSSSRSSCARKKAWRS